MERDNVFRKVLYSPVWSEFVPLAEESKAPSAQSIKLALLDTRITAQKYPYHIYQSTHITTLLKRLRQLFLACALDANKPNPDLRVRLNKIIPECSHVLRNWQIFKTFAPSNEVAEEQKKYIRCLLKCIRYTLNYHLNARKDLAMAIDWFHAEELMSRCVGLFNERPRWTAFLSRPDNAQDGHGIHKQRQIIPRSGIRILCQWAFDHKKSILIQYGAEALEDEKYYSPSLVGQVLDENKIVDYEDPGGMSRYLCRGVIGIDDMDMRRFRVSRHNEEEVESFGRLLCKHRIFSIKPGFETHPRFPQDWDGRVIGVGTGI